MVQDPLGAEFITQDLPCNFGEGQDIDGPGPSQWVQAMGHFLVPSKIGPPMAPMDHRPRCAVHGPWTADHSVWSMVHGPRTADHSIWSTDHRTPRTSNGQKKAINTLNQKMHPEPRKGQKGHKFKLHQKSP
ncbi:hypothetical protein O181_085968 [Austropuccinia psidii MF-1]|uniref:Uncharacterized protein n=1 Tax=Austropuccinia psidii MF-1 TaxID=1389203 RepID=A0A9Q3FYI3_9BASI|nr:hypothetical protein [Austropuccinia psidii MF-1]